MLLTIKIMDKDNRILCETSGENFTDLVCEREYEEGDRIVLASSEKIQACGFSWTMRWVKRWSA